MTNWGGTGGGYSVTIMKKLKFLQNGSGSAPSCRAIDIGTTGIRIVALKKWGKKARLTDLREHAIPRDCPGGASPEIVLDVLRSQVRGKKFKEEIISTALPIHQIFVRSLELPFSKISQIRQVIAAEAELHVPFPLEQVVIDFWPVEELEGEKTRVIMMAAKKTVLEDHLRMLAAVGIDPTKVNVDLLGFCRACTCSSHLPPDEVTMLLEIGAVHTGVAFFAGGSVVSLRSFSWGGDTVTSLIMQEMGCGFTEAEAMKITASALPGGDDRLAKAGAAAYSRLETELLRTISSASAATGGRMPRHLILCGGGGQQAGFADYLSRRLDLSLLELKPFSEVVSRKFPNRPPTACGALGLALSEITPPPARVDFRREEFTFEGSWKKIRRRLFITAGLGAVLIIMLALGLFWKIRLEEKASEVLARRIRMIVRRNFPDAPVPPPGEELKAMQEGVETAGQKLKVYNDLVSVSSLDVLREISAIIPENIKVQVVIMDIDDKRVLFRGRTGNYRSMELIKNSLAKSDYFEGDKIRESKEAKTLEKNGQLQTVEFEYYIPLVSPDKAGPAVNRAGGNPG